MVPTDAKLLDLIRRTAKQISSQITDPHLESLLSGIDVVANELISRQQPEFYIRHYAAGRELVASGVALAAGSGGDISRLFQTEVLPNEISADTRFDQLSTEIDRISVALSNIVGRLDQQSTLSAKSYLESVVDWELRLYEHREQLAEAFAERETLPPAITGEQLVEYLRERYPSWTDLRLTHFRQIPGGFSKKTLLFETQDRKNGHQALVARVAPLHNFLNFDSYELPLEFGVIQYAHEHGLPVAPPLLLEASRDKLGSPFLISRMMAGQTIGTVKGAAEPLSEAAIAEIARVLVKLHKLPIHIENAYFRASHLPRWATLDMPTNTAMLVNDWRGEVVRSRLDPSASIERTLNWLTDNIPATNAKPAFLHCDFGVHNLLFEDGKITAILDWELSRIGDPADDITYFLMGNTGLVSQQTFMKHYTAAGGDPIEEFRLCYFDVYQCLKLTIAGLASLRQVEDWDSVGVSHAVFGLRHVIFSAKRLNSLIDAAERVR